MIETVDLQAIKVSRAGVLRQMRYKMTSKPAPAVGRVVDRMIVESENLAKPAFGVEQRAIERIDQNQVQLTGAVLLESQVLADLVARSSEVFVFALTLGADIGNLCQELRDERKLFDAYVMDAIATCQVNSLAGFVQKRLHDLAARRGLSVSRRFCPGYCDWDVKQQKQVFQILGDSSPAIQLNAQCAMLPQKSMSGLVGVGLPGEQVRSHIPCNQCTCGRAALISRQKVVRGDLLD